MKFIQIPKSLPESPWRPAADVYNCREGWLVKLDLAGVLPEEVEISVCGRRLIVSGVRRDSPCQPDHCCYSMEISYSRFQRVVELPCNLDDARIATDYRRGMLLVRLLLTGTKSE